MSNNYSSQSIPHWPLISLFFLFLGSALLPAGFLSAAFISSANSYLLILAFASWASRKVLFPKSLSMLLICFTLMIATGTLSGIENDRYNYLKDVWYFSNVVILICTGYVLGTLAPSLPKMIKTMIYASILIAAKHLAPFILHPELFTMPAVEVRKLVGGGHLEVALSLVFLIIYYGHWQKILRISPHIAWLAFFLCASSVVLSFSRTTVLVCLIIFFGLKGYMIGKRFVKASFLAITTATLLVSITALLPEPSQEEKRTFSGKLLRSVQELSIADYSRNSDINDNFRGYESARALIAYKDGGPIGWIIGRGLGYTIDLGMYISLGGKEMLRHIPVIHNGILYILIKAGISGLGLFLFSFLWLFRLGQKSAITSMNHDRKMAAMIVQSMIITSLVTAWIVTGPFNKSLLNSMMLILGFCLSLLENKKLWGYSDPVRDTSPPPLRLKNPLAHPQQLLIKPLTRPQQLLSHSLIHRPQQLLSKSLVHRPQQLLNKPLTRRPQQLLSKSLIHRPQQLLSKPLIRPKQLPSKLLLSRKILDTTSRNPGIESIR
jgi:O-antigen ligase